MKPCVDKESMPTMPLMPSLEPDSFVFAVRGLGSFLACEGTIEWCNRRGQWKATIVASDDPRIEVSAYSVLHGQAALKAIARWAGYDLTEDDTY